MHISVYMGLSEDIISAPPQKKNYFKVGGNRIISYPLCLVDPCYVPVYCIYSIVYFLMYLILFNSFFHNFFLFVTYLLLT